MIACVDVFSSLVFLIKSSCLMSPMRSSIMACLFKFCTVTKEEQEERKAPNNKYLCSLLEMSKPDVIVSSSFFFQVVMKLCTSSSSFNVNVTYARSVCACVASVFGLYCVFNYQIF